MNKRQRLSRIRDKTHVQLGGSGILDACIDSHAWNFEVRCGIRNKEVAGALQQVAAQTVASAPIARATISLASLLDSADALARIKRDDLRLLSTGRIDSGDVVCVANGCIDLSLQRENYVKYGLEGRPSKQNPGKHDVHIDLTQSYATPGTRYFKRLRDCFLRVPELEMFVLAQTEEGQECVRGTQSKLRMHTFSATAPQQIVPWVDEVSAAMEGPNGVATETIYDIQERLGCLLVQGDFSLVEAPPFPYDTWQCAMLTGCMSQQTVRRLVERIFAIAGQADVVFHVSGMQDAPWSWTKRAHGYGRNGQNDYTALVGGSSDSSDADRRIVLWKNACYQDDM